VVEQHRATGRPGALLPAHPDGGAGGAPCPHMRAVREKRDDLRDARLVDGAGVKVWRRTDPEGANLLPDVPLGGRVLAPVVGAASQKAGLARVSGAGQGWQGRRSAAGGG